MLFNVVVMFFVLLCDFFFFKQKTAYEMRISYWSSDVCSSDLPPLLLVEDRVERLPLDRRQLLLGKRPLARDARRDDVDHPVGAVEAAPQIVILAIGAAEKGAEAVELDALQHRRRAAGADRGRVRRGDAVDLDRVEIVISLALQQRRGRDVVRS